ncbi:hypothetical protein Ahy_A06g026249 [Arachis hypogaea]|uniref:Uncharacterized protein n=1 Tax=Arachis hypogaea TaxID=3818 RepID=A0A445CJX4_ARAHY|nr:hypothetical protein Ahy_A06g026249 [Arachis hypogaea]
MASLSMSSVLEQNRDDNNNKNNSISNKFLLPKKPISLCIICIPSNLQYLETTKARQPNPIIYRRLSRGSMAARISEDDEEHNFLHNDEKRKQELDKSMQKPNKNSGYNLTRKHVKKRNL